MWAGCEREYSPTCADASNLPCRRPLGLLLSFYSRPPRGYRHATSASQVLWVFEVLVGAIIILHNGFAFLISN